MKRVIESIENYWKVHRVIGRLVKFCKNVCNYQIDFIPYTTTVARLLKVLYFLRLNCQERLSINMLGEVLDVFAFYGFKVTCISILEKIGLLVWEVSQ